LPNR